MPKEQWLVVIPMHQKGIIKTAGPDPFDSHGAAYNYAQTCVLAGAPWALVSQVTDMLQTEVKATVYVERKPMTLADMDPNQPLPPSERGMGEPCGPPFYDPDKGKT